MGCVQSIKAGDNLAVRPLNRGALKQSNNGHKIIQKKPLPQTIGTIEKWFIFSNRFGLCFTLALG